VIAATALNNGFILVTSNTKDFKNISDLVVLNRIKWYYCGEEFFEYKIGR
jgi:hypothetical protein